MRLALRTLLLLSILLLVQPSSGVSAQVFYFQVEKTTADVYWESDGTVRVEYEMVLYNDPSADRMEDIDIGVPTSSYSLSSISATIDSVVSNSDAIDAAFCSALLVTLVGSMIPVLTRSQNSPF